VENEKNNTKFLLDTQTPTVNTKQNQGCVHNEDMLTFYRVAQNTKPYQIINKSY